MPNRLKDEPSPYLQQHAENPVEWYPWGEEALIRAREEDKPILLSIGYSACHWCHVMERESFEDENTANLMNQGFVNIKVDREERPDLDSIYMRAVQASTGRGGWPLTAFLLPDGRFFYGGTYFPPETRYGMPSFRQVLRAVLDAYENRREEVEEGSRKLLEALQQPSPPRKGSPPPDEGATSPAPGRENIPAGLDPGGTKAKQSARADPGTRIHNRGPELLQTALGILNDRFDPIRGGFGPAPKFPQPTTLEFLLHHHHRVGNPKALDMALTTLRAMARGGIRDHLGGGFHRYSVDDEWLVPHFEKMLYDNGLLARLFLHAHLVTGDAELVEACTSTLDYLLQDLRHPDGGFFSARDADSEGEEGVFYVWRPEEILETLGEERGELFCRIYGVTASGNFEGANILHLAEGLDSLARKEGMEPGELRREMHGARATLLERRRQRERPFRDEKILVAWNSFALRALAEAGISLGREDYLEAAVENARFVLGALVRNGQLFRSWKDGEIRVPAFLEDHAGLANGLLTLYEATLDPRWLQEARELADRILDQFWSRDHGLLFDSSREGEELIMRARDPMDNATPSGNSMAVELLLRLHGVLGREDYLTRAHEIMDQELDVAAGLPSAFGHLLAAVHRTLEPPVEIAMLGELQDPELQALRAAAHQPFLPNRIVAGGPAEGAPELPLLEGREMSQGKATAYVCRDFTCSRPLHHPDELRRELEPAVRRPGNPVPKEPDGSGTEV